MTFFQRASDAHPDNPHGPIGLARLAFRNRRIDESAAHWRRVLEIDQTRPEAWIGLAEISLELNDLDKGLEQIALAEKNGAAIAQTFPITARINARLGQTERALELLAELRGKAPGVLAGHLDAATLLMSQERSAEAEKLLRSACALFPDKPFVHISHLRALAKIGNRDCLVDRIDEIRTKLPNPNKYMLAAAEILRDAGFLADAEKVAREVLNGDGKQRAVQLLASIAEARGDWSQAREHWSELADVFECDEGYIGRARAFRHLREWRQAEAELDLLSRKHGGNPPSNAFAELAFIANHRGDHSTAADLFKKLMTERPQALWLRAALARALARAGNVEEARKILREAGTPIRDVGLMTAWLDIEMHDENFRMAARWAARVIRENPDRSQAAPMLIEALVSLGHEHLAEALITGQLAQMCTAEELALCRFVLEF